MSKKNWKFAYSAIGLALVACLSNQAIAATAAEARDVTTIQPGALEENFRAPMFQTPEAKTKQIVVPTGEQKIPGQAEKIVFLLKQINLTGADIYTQEDFRRFYADKIGQEISLADLYAIAEGITKQLRQDGYIISKAYIPPQHISSGTAEIRIIGGYIDNVSFKGEDAEFDMTYLHAYAEKILGSRPLQIKTLERYALLANDLPGIQSRIVLSPSEEQPGAAHLTFFITKQPVSAYAGYNNRGTLYTGPQQLSAGVSLNTLASGSKIGLHTAASTEFSELRYGQFYWDQYIGTDGLQFGFDTSRTVSRPGFDLSDLEIEGVTQTYSAGLTYPIIRAHSRNWFTNLEVQGWNTRSVTQIDDGLLYTDKVRTLALGTTYNFTDSKRGSNSVQLKATKGLPVFGYTHTNPPSDEPSTRTKGSAVFTKLNLSASRLQALPKHLSALLAFNGQYSFDRLLSSQEFSFGGSQFGLGYDPSEILGDHGASARFELRYDATVPRLSQLQPFVSYDIGSVWHKSPKNVDEPSKESGSSVALGVRAGWSQYVNASFTLARPLTLELPENIAKGDSRRPWRGFFNITAQY